MAPPPQPHLSWTTGVPRGSGPRSRSGSIEDAQLILSSPRRFRSIARGPWIAVLSALVFLPLHLSSGRRSSVKFSGIPGGSVRVARLTAVRVLRGGGEAGGVEIRTPWQRWLAT